MTKIVITIAILPYFALCCMQTAEPGTTIAPPTTAATATSTASSTSITSTSSGSSTSTASTSSSSTTTSTASTTTSTTTEKPCGTCYASLVDLKAGLPEAQHPIQPVATCATPGILTVTCTARAGNMVGMEMNPEKIVPGPADNVVKVDLVCSNNVWKYSVGATGVVVTIVACAEANNVIP